MHIVFADVSESSTASSSTAQLSPSQPLLSHCFRANVNLIFVVERSRNMPSKVFLCLQDAMKQLMSPFSIGYRTQVSVMTLDYGTVTRRTPNRRLQKNYILNIIRRIPRSEPTDLVSAVWKLNDVVARVTPGVHNVVVYLWSTACRCDAVTVRTALSNTLPNTTVFVLAFEPPSLRVNKHQALFGILATPIYPLLLLRRLLLLLWLLLLLRLLLQLLLLHDYHYYCCCFYCFCYYYYYYRSVY